LPKEERSRLEPLVLREAIVLLASGCGDVHREVAARRLLEQIGHLARARAITRLLSRPGYRACGDDLIEDAVQHTAIAAWTGGARFRGVSPAAAVAWCLEILKNYARSEVRRRAPLQRERRFPHADSATEELSIDDAARWHRPAQEAQVILGALDAQVRSYLRRTRSERAAESLYHAVQSYVVDVAGGHPRVSRAALSTPGEDDSGEQRKARDRAYQHHHRARSILAEVRRAYEGAVKLRT
jgi:DNA-directed RNA polymerase specialized sigma24 family protein